MIKWCSVYPGAPEILWCHDNDCWWIGGWWRPGCGWLETITWMRMRWACDAARRIPPPPPSLGFKKNMQRAYVTNAKMWWYGWNWEPWNTWQLRWTMWCHNWQIISVSGPLDPKPINSKIKSSAIGAGAVVVSILGIGDTDTTTPGFEP